MFVGPTQPSPSSERWEVHGTAPGGSGAQRVAPGVTIAPARLRDLRAVARVQAQSFRPRLAYGLGTLLLLWLLPNVRFLVARMPSLPMTSAGPSPRTDPVVGTIIGDRSRGDVRVINLAVDPSARRQGVGGQLLAALETAFPEGDLILMVEESNDAARALYIRTGYRQVGIAQNYYGRGRSGIWMQKRRAGGAGGSGGADGTDGRRGETPGVPPRRTIRV